MGKRLRRIVTLREKVVTLKKIENCIALVKMEDRNSKIGFSLELIEDLLEVFNTINYDYEKTFHYFFDAFYGCNN